MWPEELLKTVSSMASSELRCSSIEAHADGVGAAVGDQRIVGGDAVENRRCVDGNFARGKAEAARQLRIDLEVGGRAADGVVDAVLDVDDAGNLADGVAHARAQAVRADRHRREELDLDRFGRIRQIADHVLQNLGELDVELRLGGLDLLAHVLHHVVNGAAALGLQLHGEVAGVGFGHGGQAHLQAGAARSDFHFGSGVQDPLHVLENAVGLAQASCPAGMM